MNTSTTKRMAPVPICRNSFAIAACVAVLTWCSADPLAAATFNWKAGATGYWSDTNNWAETAVPGAGDDVYITNSGALAILTNSTDYLGSFVLARTLTFSNWNTTLSAASVQVIPGGMLTLPAAFTNDQMSNNICIVCTNFTLEAGGMLNADEKGYRRGDETHSGYGPGGGGAASGGGYGGYGAGTGGGQPYGSANAPIQPGSGGGQSWGYSAGSGGGAIRIEADGTATIRGTITANGGACGGGGGGGTGGGIFIRCDRLDGATNGLISANGGSGNNNGGGGGRIAVVYNPASQIANPGVRFSAAPGGPTEPIGFCGDGSLFLTNALFMSENITNRLFWRVVLCIPGMTNWAGDHLILNDSWITFQPTNFNLTVTNQVAATNGGLGLMPGSSLSSLDLTLNNSALRIYRSSAVYCANDLLITNSGRISVFSDATNAATADYGALISATGNMILATGCWIYPYSEETNGGSALFRMGNLTVATNAGFNADTKGFTGSGISGVPGSGPGGGVLAGAGGGYGGQGGGAGGGQPYGGTNYPIHAGSGGCASWGYISGDGGGSVRIEAHDIVTLNGTITADGGEGVSGGGGGSGGGIYIRCVQLQGANNALLSADGGAGSGGGGGGGRIAIWEAIPESKWIKLIKNEPVSIIVTNCCKYFFGQITVSNGIGSGGDGGTGTEVCIKGLPSGSVTCVR